MKTYYICKREEICPMTNTACSPECRLTSKPEMAKNKKHTFHENANGDLIENDEE